jgi:hypothetical protein
MPYVLLCPFSSFNYKVVFLNLLANFLTLLAKLEQLWIIYNLGLLGKSQKDKRLEITR